MVRGPRVKPYVRCRCRSHGCNNSIVSDRTERRHRAEDEEQADPLLRRVRTPSPTPPLRPPEIQEKKFGSRKKNLGRKKRAIFTTLPQISSFSEKSVADSAIFVADSAFFAKR